MSDRRPGWWARVNQVLDEVLDLKPEEHKAFLDEHCTDSSIRADVQSLLHEIEAAEKEGFLDGPIDLEAAAFHDALQDLDVENGDDQTRDDVALLGMIGETIGAYRIERVLGRGGMGAVFLAERDDGEYQQQVALKVMRRDLFEREDLMARLRRERQIMASLDHEHVARLLDGGVDGKGRPYIVMEYIEGETIDAYCDGQGLNIDDRLRLFQQVGKAVAAAHRRAVIHRDLKPSNVLIHEHEVGGDGLAQTEPRAKLLDFGIAKLVEPDADPSGEDCLERDSSRTALTRTGMAVMTPEYAAPEQIQDEGVTTATDVYQLGVVLYELLTGQRPFRDETSGKWGRAHLRALEEAILTTEPERPSTAATRLGDEAARKTRGSDAMQLSQRFRGDLDAICLKALRKEPEARYASVDAMLEDIARYLSGRPVSARRGTAWYRSRKFAGRHWREIAIGVAFAALIIGGVVIYTIQVTQERDRAKSEAQKAEAVSNFLVDLFAVTDPYSTEVIQGDTLTAGVILERGADRVREELAEQPEIQATMLTEIGRIYVMLSFFSKADTLLREAIYTREKLFGEDHPEVAEPIIHLAGLKYDQQQFESAEALARRAVDIQKTSPERRPFELAKSYNILGVTLERRGSYDEAEQHYQEALAILRSHFGPSHLEVAKALTNLAVLREKGGDYSAAESLHLESLTIKEGSLSSNHPDLANSYNHLGELFREQGRYGVAEKYQRKALAGFQASFGDDHPKVAFSLNDLAITLENQGQLQEAQELLEGALGIKTQRFGRKSTTVATSLNNLAIVLRKQGKYAEAEKVHREVLALDRDLVGTEHRWVATDLNEIATVVAQQGQLDEAEGLFRESLAMRKRLLGDDHPHVAYSMGNLGGILVAKGDLQTAESLLLDSFDILIRKTAPSHQARRTAIMRLVKLYEEWNKPDEISQWQAKLKAAESDSQSVGIDEAG